METVEYCNTKVKLLLERLTFGGKNHSRPIKAGKVTEGEPMSYLRKVVGKKYNTILANFRVIFSKKPEFGTFQSNKCPVLVLLQSESSVWVCAL